MRPIGGFLLDPQSSGKAWRICYVPAIDLGYRLFAPGAPFVSR